LEDVTTVIFFPIVLRLQSLKRRANKMSKWKKYKDSEPFKRLRNEGRELLGEIITITEKRDGENVSIWLDDDGATHISSRRLEDAEGDIRSRMMATPEWSKINELLHNEREYGNDFIAYGELLKGVSPTRIEPRRKHIHWILFDMWNVNLERYEAYNYLYQRAYQFKIPIVRALDEFSPATLEEVQIKVDEWLKWCRRHRREGIVGKTYYCDDQHFFKEKIDLPKRKRVSRKDRAKPLYPPMPEERILRALQHAFDEVGEENWKNVKTAMPVVARHIATEAEEHNYNRPNNFYSYYVNTTIEQLRGSNGGS